MSAPQPAIGPATRVRLAKLLTEYRRKPDALLTALYLVQAECNHLSETVLDEFAEIMELPKSVIYEVTTFYTMYSTKPTGRNMIMVCQNLCCFLRGTDDLIMAIARELGIQPGETTPDRRFTLRLVECLAACERAPAIQINEKLMGPVTPADVPKILCGVPLMSTPRIIYRDLETPDLRRLEVYRSKAGYQAFEKALRTMTPSEVIETVKASRLVGRGGAGFPTGLKWELVAREAARPKFLVANAEEGEPGTFKDLPILTRIPHRLIEGMLIGAYAVGAAEGVIVCRGEFMEPQRILREAIAEAEAAHLLGEHILGSDFSFKLWVYRTAGAYICGEETSLLEALEGKPGMPRIRPPFPVSAGLWSRPTALNNVETFANVPAIILNGAEAYAALGTERNSGTKGFCISGHVNRPGVYEIPFGVTLRSLIDDYAGGILDGRAFKAVFPGGASSSCLTAEHLDLPLDFHHVAQAGSMLGSAAFMVISEGVCMVEVALRLARFFRHESCGKCIPCRDGTYQIVRLLERMKRGESVTCEIEDIVDLASVMRQAAFCGLGQAAPNPVLSCIKHFRAEFDAHCAGEPCTLLGGGERPYGHHD